jgi:phage-related protein
MGSSAQVTFAFLAKDAASATIRGLSKTVSGLGTVASKVGGILKTGLKIGLAAVAGAVAGASAALVKFTKDAIDDEAAQSKLNAVLKARGLATKENLAATEEAIKAGQKLAFTDDDVRASLATATQFTNNFTKAQKISTVAQDLARAKNISLEKATLLVGRAYDGNTTALSRMGIAIEKGAKGTKALDAVSGKFAGSAKAYTQTTAGGIETLSIQLQEAGESIGQSLLPIVNELLQAFIDKGLPVILSVVDGIKSFIDNNRELIKSVFETVTGFVGNLIPVLVQVGEFIFGTIIPAIVGFVQKLTAPGGVTDSVGKVVGGILDNLVPAFGKFFDGVGKLVGKVFELVGVLWGDGSGPLAIAVQAIGGAFSIVLSILGNIGGAIATAIDFIMKLGKAIMDSPIGFLIKAIAGVVGGAAGAIGAGFGLSGNTGVVPAAVTSGGGRDSVGGRDVVVSNSIIFGRDASSSVNTSIGARTSATTGTRNSGRF